MTDFIVQLYVENLLKMLKVLKTRTALIRNGLAAFRCAPYGKALKRQSKQRSKAELQEKITNLLQLIKIAEKAIDKWYNKDRKKQST